MGTADFIVERNAQQVTLQLPEHSAERVRRLKDGLPPTVSIDPCIVECIKELWENGIETTGCCCGHRRQRAWVNVASSSYEKMYELGYELKMPELIRPGVVHGLYTFYLGRRW
ncbi:hypothetical protein DXN05_03460 [Deminuibacter soli]|uniref:Uncharacterized protein n=2 Tax=Deminuibacter soli TaxID=2291815 RepID=A0A3E1NQ39_9BACT|nr:hypothetical protein DXN05_03460 [Deminuibacter soli]